MASAAKQLDACVDTCILINFALVSRIDLLGKIPGYVFYLLDEVLDEITVPEQKQQVDAAVRNGDLKTARIETVDELATFVAYTAQFGKGESACLAVATCRSWIVATDETKDRRLARELAAKGIEVINTPGIILKAVREGVLNVEGADAIKDELAKNRFRMNFNSFRDLLGGGTVK